MIGWVIVLFIPAFISLLLISAQNNKVKAKKTCLAFEKRLSQYGQQFEVSVAQIAEKKTYDYNDKVIDSKTNLYLISKLDSKIKLYSINNQKNHMFSEVKYGKLMAKLKKKRVIYKYSIDSFSLYYKCSAPYENCILRLDYPPQNIFNLLPLTGEL